MDITFEVVMYTLIVVLGTMAVFHLVLGLLTSNIDPMTGRKIKKK